MVRSYIRKATVEDAVEVALYLRDADKDEIWASGKHLPVPCLIKAHTMSTECFALIVGDKVACVFGVAPLSMLGSVGIPWMLGTNLVEKYPLLFLRKCQNSVLAMSDSYATLINYVDARNKMAIKWLSWSGFHVFEEPEPYGPFGMNFHRFEIRK